MKYATSFCMPIDNEDGTITYSGPCYCGCDQEYNVTVPADTIERWQAGEPIQNIIPQTSREDREFLISGYRPDCWDRTFK